jgi:hypothetical protein
MRDEEWGEMGNPDYPRRECFGAKRATLVWGHE